MNKKVILTFGIATLSCGLASSALVAADDTQFSVTVNPYLNVTLSDGDIHLPITPSSTGAYGSANFSAYASTNNAYGYKLNLSIKDGSTSSANLTTDLKSNVINVNTGVAPVIPTFSTNDVLTAAEFSASTSTDHINHWAMSVGDTDHYQKVLSESTIATSDSPAIDDETVINLATKLDLLTSPGSYSAYFNFAVVANPVPPESNPINTAMGNANKQPVTINGQQYYKMQDMTTAICNSITTPTASDSSDTPTAKLVDIRDNKIYWVAKLKDGKCWMTQNLDLNLTHVANDADALYTHENTDLGWGSDTSTLSWNPTRSTIPTTDISNTGSISTWSNDSNAPYSVDPGDWYWTDTWYDDFCMRVGECNYLSGHLDGKFSQDPYLGNGTHGHVGNYYNWTATIASNDSSSYDYQYSGADPQNSICPAGWRLPSNKTSSDYATLLDEYEGYDYTDLFMTTSPLFFVRGGYIDNGLQEAGYAGRYRNSNIPSLGHLSFSENGPSPYMEDDTYTDRQWGMSVRCVVR